MTILELNGIAKHFSTRGGVVRAVDGVSFRLARGETLALVGESGCGKSTTARLALRLIEPSAGTLHFDGADITKAPAKTLRAMRRRAQIVFQDPYASLNPRHSIAETLEEPLLVHGIGDAASRRARVAELLSLVGLSPFHAERFPHEFSGGQRQRIGIARALAAGPDLVVCDEPVSALDVSIQAQVVNLLKDLQARFGLAYLFIAHDLAVVRHMADRVAVMYLGRIVEQADKRSLFAAPSHPYTRALLAAIPRPDPAGRGRLSPPPGDPPSPINPPAGCPFHPRCGFAEARCATDVPPLRAIAPGHVVACHLAESLPPQPAAVDDRPSENAMRRIALSASRMAAKAM
ncbi:ABC transporter ATP-binding protein [Humitalea sp. 24SJ18S-53]|uniref:ABC transporter ATP-binding protein n=1 Tax=Humitalea sp. 24SJ18S-53 TaxID=3422307 RepID=UPI003D675E9B